MKQSFLFLCVISHFLFSCKKNNDCQNCKYISSDDASFIFTIDSFSKNDSRNNWCNFVNKYDTIQFTDASGNIIAEGIKTCN
jgi:hypothetical protein